MLHRIASQRRALWPRITSAKGVLGSVAALACANGTRYFRVVYRLYWYLDGSVSGSTSTVAWDHFENRPDKI